MIIWEIHEIYEVWNLLLYRSSPLLCHLSSPPPATFLSLSLYLSISISILESINYNTWVNFFYSPFYIVKKKNNS